MVLEAEKFKIKVLAGLLSAEGSLPASQTVIFSLCPHLAKVAGGPVGTLIRALILCMRTPPSWPSHLLISPPRWLGFQYINLGEHIHSDHSSETEETLSKTDTGRHKAFADENPFPKAIYLHQAYKAHMFPQIPIPLEHPLLVSPGA